MSAANMQTIIAHPTWAKKSLQCDIASIRHYLYVNVQRFQDWKWLTSKIDIKYPVVGDEKDQGESEIDSFIHSLTIKHPVYKHSNDKPNGILLPSPERPLNSFVFPGFWLTLWPSATRSSWTTLSSRTLRYEITTWALVRCPCTVWLVSFPVYNKWEVSPFSWTVPTTVIADISLSYWEFCLFALMGYMYCLNV